MPSDDDPNLACRRLRNRPAWRQRDGGRRSGRGAGKTWRKVRRVQGAAVDLTADAAKWGPAEYRLLGACAGLKKVTLDGKTLNDETLALLAGLNEVEEFSTNQSTLTDDGYRHFAAFTKLRGLSLWHPSWSLESFTGSGLAHLKSLPNLRRLTFAGSTTGDAAYAAVGELAQLEEFHTWHTMPTPGAIKHLAKLPTLKVVRIGQRLPRWGGEPLKPTLDGAAVAVLAGVPSLERLELFEAVFTAADLEPLAKLPNLKQLKIHQTAIAPADVEKLRTSLPNVKFDFTPLAAGEAETLLVKKLRLTVPDELKQ
ncbi:MAG: hypothetical protein QM775_01315 [Pirellulales bacterium]